MPGSGFSTGDYKIINRKIACHGFFYVQSIELSHRFFAGGWSAPIGRELLHCGDVGGVLFYDPVTDWLVPVEQIRIGVSRCEKKSPCLLELLAGMVEEGEEGEEFQSVAKREAVEEAIEEAAWELVT